MGRKYEFQKKIKDIEVLEIDDSELIDEGIVEVGSDDEGAELVGVDGDVIDEEIIELEVEDVEEDAVEFLREFISDLMNEMIRSLEGASFTDQFMQPSETSVLQSFLRNGGSKSQTR